MFNSENKERGRGEEFLGNDLSENLLKAKSLLSTDIRYVKGVGPIAAQNLYKRGIFTVEDALFTLPKSYENRANIKKDFRSSGRRKSSNNRSNSAKRNFNSTEWKKHKENYNL